MKKRLFSTVLSKRRSAPECNFRPPKIWEILPQNIYFDPYPQICRIVFLFAIVNVLLNKIAPWELIVIPW